MDIFRTVISSGQLEKLLGETSCRFSGTAYAAVSQADFAAYSKQLTQFGFSRDGTSDRYIAEHSRQLKAFLEEGTHIRAIVYFTEAIRCAISPAIRECELLVLGALEVLPQRSEDLDHPGHCGISFPVRGRSGRVPCFLPAEGTVRGKARPIRSERARPAAFAQTPARHARSRGLLGPPLEPVV